MDAGLIRGDHPGEHLVWRLMPPIGIFRMTHLRAALSAADAGHVAGAAEAIRTVLEDAPVPEAVAHAAVLSYEAMGAPAVAVRSSATAEDLPTASFAGQQETVLGVVGTTALLDAV